MIQWIVLLVGFLEVSSQQTGNNTNKYDDYNLVKLIPSTPLQVEAVKQFSDPDQKVEIFKLSHGVNDSLDVLVPSDRMEFIANYSRLYNLTLNVKERYGRSFEQVSRVPRRRQNQAFSLFEYHSYARILEFLHSVAERYAPVVTLDTIGRSYEGRPLKLVKISTNPGAGNPIILIDAGIHAREWAAPAMAVYIIQRLASSRNSSELQGVDWYIIPMVNPDGYEYTRSSQSHRLWRKTRSRYVTSCYGVDGNRNYGFKWAVSGVSRNPCNQETFAGPKPFSESETTAVRNTMTNYKDRIKLYVSLHAYGQYLVYPWGYTGATKPPTWKKLDRLAKTVSAAVVRAGGSPFTVMSAGEWYPAAGGSDDYAFGALGVPYSYTMELTSGYEFQYPDHLLHKTLPPFYEGFRAFGAEIRKEFHLRSTKSNSDRDEYQGT